MMMPEYHTAIFQINCFSNCVWYGDKLQSATGFVVLDAHPVFQSKHWRKLRALILTLHAQVVPLYAGCLMPVCVMINMSLVLIVLILVMWTHLCRFCKLAKNCNFFKSMLYWETVTGLKNISGLLCWSMTEVCLSVRILLCLVFSHWAVLISLSHSVEHICICWCAAKKYDAFLASDSLIKQIPRIVGPGLNKAGKFPTMLTHSESMMGKIDEVKATIKFQMKKVSPFAFVCLSGLCLWDWVGFMFGFAAEAVSCAQLQEFHTVVNCYIKSAKNGYFGKIQRHDNCSKLPLSESIGGAGWESLWSQTMASLFLCLVHMCELVKCTGVLNTCC